MSRLIKLIMLLGTLAAIICLHLPDLVCLAQANELVGERIYKGKKILSLKGNVTRAVTYPLREELVIEFDQLSRIVWINPRYLDGYEKINHYFRLEPGKRDFREYKSMPVTLYYECDNENEMLGFVGAKGSKAGTIGYVPQENVLPGTPDPLPAFRFKANTPQGVVERYLSLRFNNVPSTDEFIACSPYRSWTDEPGWDFAHLIKGYRIIYCEQAGNEAKVWIEFAEIGDSFYHSIDPDVVVRTLDYKPGTVVRVFKLHKEIHWLIDDENNASYPYYSSDLRARRLQRERCEVTQIEREHIDAILKILQKEVAPCPEKAGGK